MQELRVCFSNTSEEERRSAWEEKRKQVEIFAYCMQQIKELRVHPPEGMEESRQKHARLCAGEMLSIRLIRNARQHMWQPAFNIEHCRDEFVVYKAKYAIDTDIQEHVDVVRDQLQKEYDVHVPQKAQSRIRQNARAALAKVQRALQKRRD